MHTAEVPLTLPNIPVAAHAQKFCNTLEIDQSGPREGTQVVEGIAPWRPLGEVRLDYPALNEEDAQYATGRVAHAAGTGTAAEASGVATRWCASPDARSRGVAGCTYRSMSI